MVGPDPNTPRVMTDLNPPMVWIPPGAFMMGTTDAELDREGVPMPWRLQEQPRHRVVFEQGFYLGQYPVTRGEFSRFVADIGHEVPNGVAIRTAGKRWVLSDRHDWRDPGFPQDDHHPVTCVGFGDAEAYAAWLSARTGRLYRLPTEAEWEYACRAGTDTARFWGDDPGSAQLYANVADDSLARALGRAAGPERYFGFDDGFAFTSPVGSFRPNPFGLFDMLGNVWEYTSGDWVADYMGSGATLDGHARALRGGSWDDGPRNIRAGLRYRFDGRGAGTGFRLAIET